ncbi:hypothetical protein BQ8482_440008 [Mesorhizobium delmotii]|uniref:Uncharacterized protein n=1 Tax=Mesorhizobium delmotii TaxID=1631247 RepID=A0A2P9ATG5_9HYPH|nr:hypothetical protein BQ8482_440008 [Mesorhizobium delmotii]
MVDGIYWLLYAAYLQNTVTIRRKSLWTSIVQMLPSLTPCRETID